MHGVAVETADREVVAVGTWFIRHRAEPNRRLVRLDIRGEATDHGVPVLPRITSWDSDTEQ